MTSDIAVRLRIAVCAAVLLASTVGTFQYFLGPDWELSGELQLVEEHQAAVPSSSPTPFPEAPSGFVYDIEVTVVDTPDEAATLTR
ncbi:hypothetical protein AB0G04_24405 [Actinoplanes sp. NPDC023801]|uniref:hypothetical protein n=1 Tax=Actinoplanes sp. NPDC023801 TaxID=3154595 RepID=UPI0033C4C323